MKKGIVNVPSRKSIEKSIPGFIGVSSQDFNLSGVVFNEIFLPAQVNPGEGVTPATQNHKIGLIFKGSVKAKTAIDRQRWRPTLLQASDVYITPAEREVQWSWESEKPDGNMICLAFHVATNRLNETLQNTFDIDAKNFELHLRNTLQDPLMVQLIIDIYQHIRHQKTADNLYIESVVEFMLIRLIQLEDIKPTQEIKNYRGFNRSFLQLLLHYIDEHLSERISISELANFSGMSKYHFMRLFQVSMGVSCHQYTIDRRLKRADDLLLNTRLPITEIAFEVGYDSISNFSSAYKKNKGYSPREFRKDRA